MSSFLKQIKTQKNSLKSINSDEVSYKQIETLGSADGLIYEPKYVQKLQIDLNRKFTDRSPEDNHRRESHEKPLKKSNCDSNFKSLRLFQKEWSTNLFEHLMYPTESVTLRLEEQKTLLNRHYQIFKDSIDERRVGDIEYLIGDRVSKKDYTLHYLKKRIDQIMKEKFKTNQFFVKLNTRAPLDSLQQTKISY